MMSLIVYMFTLKENKLPRYKNLQGEIKVLHTIIFKGQ